MTPSSSINKEHIAELRNHLKHPDIDQIEEEYARLLEQDRFHTGPKWYKLFGGPKNIYKLAEAVGMLSEYKIYYEWWSATVHGSDATRLLLKQEDGSTEFRPLRSLQHAEHMEQGAEVFLQLACQLMVRKFLGECELKGLLQRFAANAAEDR